MIGATYTAVLVVVFATGVATSLHLTPSTYHSQPRALLLSGLQMRASRPGDTPGPRSISVVLSLHNRCLPSLVLPATNQGVFCCRTVMLCEVTSLTLGDGADAV